jgi:DNA modification methylase
MLNQCHIGDCRELLKQFAAAGVRAQMCVTSPPYFGLRDYGHANQIGLEATPDAFVAELVAVFRGVRDVLADDGTVWLNLGDTYARDPAKGDRSEYLGLHKNIAASGCHTASQRRQMIAGIKPKDLLGIPWRVAFALQADGWYLRSDIIWHKPNPMPESVTDRPTKAHEYLFLLAKSERYYYDADAIKEPTLSLDPSHSSYRPNSAAIAEVGRKEYSNKHEMSARSYDPAGRNKRSVWTVTTKPFEGAHFATFPAELIEPCVLAGSRPGDVVLDPFMGSGTTAQVAEHLGRQWIGCELNPDYMPLQAKRLAQRAMAF